MAAKFKFRPLRFQIRILLLVLFSEFSSASQSNPQNIQVYFPSFTTPTPPLVPSTSPPSETTTAGIPAVSRSSNKPIAKAVAITASSSLVLSGLLFLLLLKFKRRSKKETTNLYADNRVIYGNENRGLKKDEFVRVGTIKRVVVDDEEGLDVIYWQKLQENGGRKSKFDFPVQEIHLLRGKSSSSRVYAEEDRNSDPVLVANPLKDVKNQKVMESQQSLKTPPPSNEAVPAGAPPPLPPPPGVVVERKSSAPPPPPPVVLVERKSSAPPPPPPLPPSNEAVPAGASPPLPPPPGVVVERKSSAPPPPPPGIMVEKKGSAPPPPLPPKNGGLTLSSRRPPPPPPPLKGNMSLSNDNQVKLKPLHWDKVNANVGHDMVWHKLHNGSFRVDDDQMKTLFGTTAINEQSPRHVFNNSPKKKGEMKSGTSKIFLLETRKSQNIAIVLKSIAVSRDKIIDSLLEGRGVDIDTLEKLNRITPSKEEATIILEFEGDITKLADAESFLYHILRSVPSAFTRISIMLFKLNYNSEVLDLNSSLRTLETACKELKARGLFVKLLEAVLKAGNRMNAGTSRGNAQAFDLNSLLKLSDVKSSDGTTTLLHFVVEEVVRLEGKRCNINKSTGHSSSDKFTENYYIKLGLPVVGGVSSEFFNVKKAAGIDYDGFSKSCLGLRNQLSEIKKSMEECDGDGRRGGFVREIERFIEEAEREIEKMREEEGRVMGIVKKTNEYYQTGGSKGFELFVIIRGFLEMVDKACVDIAVKLQKRRNGGGSQKRRNGGGSPVKFTALPEDYRIGVSSSSSDSD